MKRCDYPSHVSSLSQALIVLALLSLLDACLDFESVLRRAFCNSV
jgi:hypothetical protein